MEKRSEEARAKPIRLSKIGSNFHKKERGGKNEITRQKRGLFPLLATLKGWTGGGKENKKNAR